MARPPSDDEDDFMRAMMDLDARPIAKPTSRSRADARPATPEVIEDADFEALMRNAPDGKVAPRRPEAPAKEAVPAKEVAPAKPEPRRRYEASAAEVAEFLAAVDGPVAPKDGAPPDPSAADAIDVEAIVRRLRRGQLEPDATLDLHGARRDQALDRTRRFLAEARAEKWRVVRVVVGKGLHSEGGDAVVGPAVEELLGGKATLAVMRAPPHLGGTGALLAIVRLE